MRIDVNKAYYIKLGVNGHWEAESIRDGVIRFGYDQIPQNLAEKGNWDGVRKAHNWSDNAGAMTRHISQIRAYYEADETDVFITFSGGLLYWCRPTGPITRLEDGSHSRGTVDGWHSTSIGGTKLTEDTLSGNLLKLEMFRGTICKVGPQDYLVRKLNDELLPEVSRALAAEKEIVQANISLMRLLTWQDFELLVDLIFTSSGWRRLATVGRTKKTVDLELVLPTTNERAFVQVKSRADDATLTDYVQRFESSELYDRMFFVWHSGNVNELEENAGVTLIGPEQLAQMVLDSGLSSWLREKVS